MNDDQPADFVVIHHSGKAHVFTSNTPSVHLPDGARISHKINNGGHVANLGHGFTLPHWKTILGVTALAAAFGTQFVGKPARADVAASSASMLAQAVVAPSDNCPPLLKAWMDSKGMKRYREISRIEIPAKAQLVGWVDDRRILADPSDKDAVLLVK